MTALAVAVLAALAAFGVLVTVSAWTTPPAPRTTERTPWLTPELLARAGGAVVAGALGLVGHGLGGRRGRGRRWRMGGGGDVAAARQRRRRS